MIAPPQLNSLQQWRQLCYLTTAAVHDIEQFLELAAETIAHATAATVCTFLYHAPDGATLRAASGDVPLWAQPTLHEHAAMLDHGRVASFRQPIGDLLAITVPLTVYHAPVGVFQLVIAGDIPDDELQVIAVMLANVLERHARSNQHFEFDPQVRRFIDQKRAEAESVQRASMLQMERDRLLRREVEVRTQIGRDLHDGPVQQVAMAGLMTQFVRRVAARAPEKLDEALDDLEEQLKRATQDMRTVLYELRPLGISEEGLVAVLQQYIGKLRDPNGLRVHLDAPLGLRRLAADHEAAMFIIIQEAINNVRKHAAAQNVWITLTDDGAALCAMVQDDGCGFDVQQTQRNYVARNNFGLLNMEERAQLSGGTCAFESVIGMGSIARIRIPYSMPSEERAGTSVL